MSSKRTALLLTDEVHDRIVGTLRLGNYVEHAASYAGISRGTLYNWLKKGDEARAKRENGAELDEVEERYARFSEDVDNARATAVVRNVSIIQQAAQTNWQAAGWWLERTAPQHYGRQMRTEVSGPNQGPVQVSVSRDELIEEINRLLDVATTDDEDDS
jgi:AcrR family transcriptional regulator